jgi:hypothetical protein
MSSPRCLEIIDDCSNSFVIFLGICLIYLFLRKNCLIIRRCKAEASFAALMM